MSVAFIPMAAQKCAKTARFISRYIPQIEINEFTTSGVTVMTELAYKSFWIEISVIPTDQRCDGEDDERQFPAFYEADDEARQERAALAG